MIKICFAHHEGKLICAHEKDYEGSGFIFRMNIEDFEKAKTDKKIEMLNDMIVAVTNAAEVKKDIKFQSYQR